MVDSKGKFPLLFSPLLAYNITMIYEVKYLDQFDGLHSKMISVANDINHEERMHQFWMELGSSYTIVAYESQSNSLDWRKTYWDRVLVGSV